MSRSVRIPDRIASEIEEIAERERRSFANAVEIVLELGLTEMQRGHPRTAPATGVAREGVQVKTDFKGGRK